MGGVLGQHLGLPVSVQAEMLATRDPLDLSGFMIPTKLADGTRPVSVYTLPSLIHRIQADAAWVAGGWVLVFLDELPQASTETQKVATDLILNYRLGEFELPERTWIVSAGNRKTDGGGANRLLTILVNRQPTFKVVANFPGWEAWAMKHAVHPMGLVFAKFRPEIVFSNSTPPRDGPFCTPRSLVKSMAFLSARAEVLGLPPDAVPMDQFTRAHVEGDIGPDAAAEFFEVAKLKDELPTPEEIKRDPMGAKLPSSNRPDAQYAAAMMLIAHGGPDHLDQLWTYAERLNGELQTVIMRAFMQASYGGVLLNSPKMSAWIREHRVLVSASL